MTDDALTLKKNSNIVSRVIGADTVLLPICRDTQEMNCIFTLNKAAARVWDLIDGKRTVAAIKKTVSTEFDVSAGELDKRMRELLNDLRSIKAVSERG